MQETLLVNSAGNLVKKRVPYVVYMRELYKENRRAVLQLTGMDEAHYFNFQFETGLAWLTHYCKNGGADTEQLRYILSQPIVWDWWVNVWNRMDDEYVHSDLPAKVAQDVSKDEVLAFYRMLHQGCFVHTYPQYGLLETGYARAIGQMNKKAK